MSRVIVKKIGKNVNEAQLRDLFSQKGEVTDVKIARKPDGSSRMFAFVGFRTELQATEAQKYFNNTFIGLSRISVEIARKLNDKELIERKEKFSKESKTKIQELKEKIQRLDGQGDHDDDSDDSDADKKKKKGNKKGEEVKQSKVGGKHKDEFMELVVGRNKDKTWTNDDVTTRQIAQVDREVDVDEIGGGGKGGDGDSDDESGSAAMNKSDDDEEDSDDDSAIDLDELIKKNSENKDKSTTVVPAVKSMSDLDYLRSKVSKAFSDDSDSDSDDDNRQAAKKKQPAAAVEEENEEEDDDKDEEEEEEVEKNGDKNDKTMTNEDGEEFEADNARLYVKNLPFTCTEDELRALFETYGKVTEVHIPLSTERKGKGFGYVMFLFPDHCERALEELHGSSFQGRVLYIEKAMKPKVRDPNLILQDLKNSKLSSFQLKKEEERRKQANRKEGWNAAFVRSDAVVESLAEQYGVEKAAIMDTTMKGGDIAVRLAIGESQVIQENKDYFLSHGVDLNALESLNSQDKVTKRSTTTLLIKNLPPDTVVDEIESMFTRFGSLAAFLVPKSKTVALVDFVEPSEARAAFKGLAYRRYKNSPLYLEWAPLGVINLEKLKKKQQQSKGNTAASSSSSASDSKNKNESNASGAGEDNLDDFSTLFIKNLNFITTDESLLSHLQRLGVEGLRTVSIQKKYKGTTVLSQGFGFAEFQNVHYASIALQKIDGSVLDSHKLEVKPSEKRLTQAPVSATKKELKNSGNVSQSAKLIVRNLAFQATKNELRQLFSAFGSVKKVRIPKKMGGNHRGFAFVDFATSQEAANAMTALKSTHLYGRHLVIEWAKDEDDDGDDDNDGPELVNKSIEASRKRAARDQKVIAATNQKAKRQKTVEGDGEDGGDGEMNDLI